MCGVELKGPDVPNHVELRMRAGLLRTARRWPLLLAGLAALAGCERNPLIVKRSPCPAVAVPVYAGDISRFQPGTAPDIQNLDFTASITNVRADCSEGGGTLVSSIRYDVVARRMQAGPERSIEVPVFASVVQGGNLLVSKDVNRVVLRFPAGQVRAVAGGTARADVNRSAAMIPDSVQKSIERKRRARDADASVDPMSDPEVRAALRAASFEVLLGFQLSETELAYNVTK
jgi:hypothetical protein